MLGEQFVDIANDNGDVSSGTPNASRVSGGSTNGSDGSARLFYRQTRRLNRGLASLYKY